MLISLFLLTPCITAALHTIGNLVLGNKSRSTRALIWLGILLTLYLFGDANYLYTVSNYRTIVFADILCQFAVPAIPVVATIYLRALQGVEPLPTKMVVLFMPSFTLGVITSTMYLSMGIDQAASYYEQQTLLAGTGIEMNKQFTDLTFVSHYIYLFIVSTEILTFLFYIVYLLRSRKSSIKDFVKWFTTGTRRSSFEIQCYNIAIFIILGVARLAFGRSFFMTHQLAAIILSLFMTASLIITFQVERLSNGKRVSVRNANLINNQSAKKEEAEESVSSKKKNEARIPAEFAIFMDAEEGFRQHGITITTVAAKLHTNRTYLSTYINNTYGLSFPEYINKRRIDFAKDYIDAHPEEKQDVIADLCGYDSVSTFNNKFKLTTGFTPGQWRSRKK